MVPTTTEKRTLSQPVPEITKLDPTETRTGHNLFTTDALEMLPLECCALSAAGGVLLECCSWNSAGMLLL